MCDEGLPVLLGCGEVECLLVDAGTQREELGFGFGGDEGIELLAGLGGWARIECAQTGKVHDAVERGLDRGAGDGGLQPWFELGAGGECSGADQSSGDEDALMGRRQSAPPASRRCGRCLPP